MIDVTKVAESKPSYRVYVDWELEAEYDREPDAMAAARYLAGKLGQKIRTYRGFQK